MTIEQLPLIMLRALALTVIIECAAAWLLGVRNRHDQIIVMLANLATNPVVVSAGAAVMVFWGYDKLLPCTLVMEVIAVAVEAAIYRRNISTGISPVMLSIVCNLTSYLLGELFNRVLF